MLNKAYPNGLLASTPAGVLELSFHSGARLLPSHKLEYSNITKLSKYVYSLDATL